MLRAIDLSRGQGGVAGGPWRWVSDAPQASCQGRGAKRRERSDPLIMEQALSLSSRSGSTSSPLTGLTPDWIPDTEQDDEYIPWDCDNQGPQGLENYDE